MNSQEHARISVSRRSSRAVRHFLPRTFLALLVLAAAAPAATAGSIPLRWTPVESPDVSGYRIYYGTAPGVYSGSIDVPPRPSWYHLSDLIDCTTNYADCTTYYIAVKALASPEVESVGYSNEISGLPTPFISSATPATVEQGQVATIVLSGANFVPGATVAFEDPAIVLQTISASSCGSIAVTVSVGLDASAGASRVIVTNPDGTYGYSDVAFHVAVQTPPSVVSSSPAAAASAISVRERRTVAFSRPMDPRTITTTTVMLIGPNQNPVPQAAGSPSLDATGLVATIVPAAALAPETLYTIRVPGGYGGAQDWRGQPMVADYLQRPGFSTAPAGTETTKAEPPYWYDDGDSEPTIYFLSSNDGPPGAYVAIYGDDFGTATGAVSFGSEPATVVSWSWRRIVVVVPQAASGAIVVRTAQGATSGARTFLLGRGAVRHLDMAAAAGGDGSGAHPWNSFLAADAAVQPGDFVIVHGGTWNAATGQTAVFKAATSGQANNTITWFAAPGERVLLDAAGSADQAIRVDGDYVNFVGFVASRARVQGMYLHGKGARAVDNEVRDGVATGGMGEGINIAGDAAAANGNYVHDNYDDGIFAYATSMAVAYNYISGSGAGATDIRGQGIHFRRSGSSVAFSKARIMRNYITGSHRSGIAIDQLSTGSDVYENIVTGNSEHCVTIGS